MQAFVGVPFNPTLLSVRIVIKFWRTLKVTELGQCLNVSLTYKNIARMLIAGIAKKVIRYG